MNSRASCSREGVSSAFDDGLVIYPSMDDEGNGGGALLTNSEQTPVLPVLP